LHRVALVGTGTEPKLRIEPDRVLFGEVPVHSTGTPVVLRLANDGSGALHVRDLRLAGADARTVSLLDDACSDATLESGADCSLSLAFAPLRDGPHRAELVIRHSAGSGMDRVPLTGIGIAARVRVDSSRLDFGDVRVGTERALRLGISNAGRAPLAIRRLRLAGSLARDFGLGADSCSGRRLDAGATCSVEVRFEPSATGLRSAVLELDHDAADGPQEVNLGGNGTPPPKPDIRLDPARLDFGSVALGESSVLEVKIRNPGSGPLELRDLSFAGPDFADFSVVPGACGDRVAPGSECTLRVRFAPTAAGLRDAVFLIRHNAAGGTHSVELLGSASEAPAPAPQ